MKCSTEELPIKVSYYLNDCSLSEILTPEFFFQINLIAPPQYVVTTNTLERPEGLAAVNTVLERIRETIEAAGGNFKISMAVSFWS